MKTYALLISAISAYIWALQFERKIYLPPLCFAIMVKRIQLFDEENFVMLTCGSLAQFETWQKAAPQTPKGFRLKEYSFTSRDDAAAWTLSALCRQISYNRGRECGGAHTAMTMPFDTWIVGQPVEKDALFRRWFGNADSDYRIALHRTPLKVSGHNIAVFWTDIYFRYSHLFSRPTHLRNWQKEDAMSFLTQWLKKYRQSYKEGRAYIERIGHQYAFSCGNLEGKS